MFWRTQIVAQSNLSELLDKETVCLKDVIEDEYVLQELKCSSKKLIVYLTKPDITAELVHMALSEAENESNLKLKYKFAHLAAEVITTDEETFTSSLVENSDVLDKLYQFIHVREQLNPLLASYYCRFVCLLFAKYPLKMLDFVRSKTDFLDSILFHIRTSAIMDLLLRLALGADGNAEREKIKEWLVSEHLSTRLTAIISPSSSAEYCSNAANIMCESIRQLRDLVYNKDDRSPDILLAQLQSSETVQQLLTHMFGGDGATGGAPTEAALVGGMQVFLALLQPYTPVARCWDEAMQILSMVEIGSFAPPSEQSASMAATSSVWIPDPEKTTERILSEKFELFHRLLLQPPQVAPIHLPSCVLETPLGQTRLEVVRLLAALLATQNAQLHGELLRLRTMHEVWGLFAKYPLNGFLHASVEKCVAAIFVTKPMKTDDRVEQSPLVDNILQSCDLVDRLVSELGEGNNEATCTDFASGHRRTKSSFGYLFRIANYLANAAKADGASPYRQQIDHVLKALPGGCAEKWAVFVDRELAVFNKHNEPDNVGLHASTSLDNIDREGADYPPPMAQLQQLFSDYQIQALARAHSPNDARTPVPMDEFVKRTRESAEESFAGELSSADIRRELDAVANAMEEGNEKMFEDICAERINTSAPVHDDDEWPERQITVAVPSQPNENARSVQTTKRYSYHSSDEDEDEPAEMSTADGLAPQSNAAPIDSAANKCAPVDDDFELFTHARVATQGGSVAHSVSDDDWPSAEPPQCEKTSSAPATTIETLLANPKPRPPPPPPPDRSAKYVVASTTGTNSTAH